MKLFEHLKIYKPARTILNHFWITHENRREKCVLKYGFDPITHEQEYWKRGIAEKEHKDILKQIQMNGNVFSVSIAKKWILSELSS